MGYFGSIWTSLEEMIDQFLSLIVINFYSSDTIWPLWYKGSSKNFSNFFSIFGPFLVIFWPKNRLFGFFGQKFLKFFFTHFIRIVLRSFCAIARFPTSIELCRLTRFIEFLIKNGQKYRFFENFRSKISRCAVTSIKTDKIEFF